MSTAVAPVLFAAGIMLQAPHPASPYSAVANSTRQNAIPPAAKAGVVRASPPSRGIAANDDGIVRLQILPPARDILERDTLLNLAPNQNPMRLSVTGQGLEATTAAVSGPDSHPAAISPSPAKESHGEIRTHTVAHHRHRPQRHAPPSLFAKIGHSVKEVFMSAMNIPHNGKEHRLWN
jgi:hypothetical protein